MKKDNIILAAAVVALVCASLCLQFVLPANEGFPDVKLTGEQGEFLAAANVEYDEAAGTISVKARTNAPDGSVVKVSAQHPYTSEKMEEYKVVDNGKVSSVFTVKPDLVPYEIPVEITMDMIENQYSDEAIEEYGAKGEKLVGENLSDKNGTTISTITVAEIPYPNEKAYKNETFNSYIYYSIVEPYSAVFASVQPAENGSWEEFHVHLTEQASTEESWSTMTDEILTGFYEMFEGLVSEAGLLEDGERAKVFFHHYNGDILAQNH